MILLCISIQKDTVNSTCIVMKCKNLPKKIFNQSKSPINFFCFLKAINLSLTYLSVVLPAYVITCSLCFSTGNLVHGGVGGGGDSHGHDDARLKLKLLVTLKDVNLGVVEDLFDH